jgi:Scramblase
MFPCFLQEMEITAPPGTLIGSVKQNWSFSPSFDVKNEAGATVLKIEGELFFPFDSS